MQVDLIDVTNLNQKNNGIKFSLTTICRFSKTLEFFFKKPKVMLFYKLSKYHKTLTKFRGGAYGGRFRKDGRLLCVGGEANVAGGEAGALVMIFDVATKNLLRLLKGKDKKYEGISGLKRSHNKSSAVTGNDTLATRVCDFTSDLKHVAGFSDDKVSYHKDWLDPCLCIATPLLIFFSMIPNNDMNTDIPLIIIIYSPLEYGTSLLNKK